MTLKPSLASTPFLNVEKFSRFSSSAVKTDKFCKTIAYACGSFGHVLSLTSPKGSNVSAELKKLSSSISMARYVFRFTGSIESYEAWKNGSWCYGDDDETVRRLVKLQTYSMLVYYPLEHLSYVGYVAPRLLQIDADRASRQSCIAWTVYVVLDIYANYLRIQALNKRERALKAAVNSANPEIQVALITLRRRRKELYYIQLRNALYFPNCLHWSKKDGVIPESLVQLLCFTEAVVGLWRSWVNQA